MKEIVVAFSVFHSAMSRKALGLLPLGLSLILSVSPILISQVEASAVSKKLLTTTSTKVVPSKKQAGQAPASKPVATLQTPEKPKTSQVVPVTQPVHITVLHVN